MDKYKNIYESSEYLQNNLEDLEEITDDDIISSLNDYLKIFNLKIAFNELINILIELQDYKNIIYDENNIKGYI